MMCDRLAVVPRDSGVDRIQQTSCLNCSVAQRLEQEEDSLTGSSSTTMDNHQSTTPSINTTEAELRKNIIRVTHHKKQSFSLLRLGRLTKKFFSSKCGKGVARRRW